MDAIKQIYTHLNLRGNQIIGLRPEVSPEEPDYIEGGIYYNPARKTFYGGVSGAWTPFGVSQDVLDLINSLASMWSLDSDGNLVTDMPVVIRNNAQIEGDTVTGGEGEDTPGTGGGIDEGQLAAYLSANNYVNSVATLTQVLGYTPVNPVTLDKYLPLSGGTISGVGADLLRINRTDSNPYIAFSNNGTHLGRIGYRSSGPIVHHGSAIYDIIHSGNYSSYALPLSGGTIKGVSPYHQFVLTLDTDNVYYTILRLRSQGTEKGYLAWANDGTNFQGIFIKNSTTGDALGLSDSGVPMYNKNTVLHSGNYATVIGYYYLKSTGGKITGPLTIETGTDAKLIFNNTDGEKYTKISFREAGTEYGSLTYSSIGIDLRGAGDLVVNGYPVITNANGIRKVAISAEPTESAYGLWQNQGVYLSVYHSANYNFAFRANAAGLQAKWQTSSSYGASWKTIAFTDSNVASATKLATARTIWGQSFDGTADVSGSLTIYKNSSDYTAGWARHTNVRNSANTILSAFGFYGTGEALEYAYIGPSYSSPQVSIRPSGNVGIGVAYPTFKLDVHGTAKATQYKSIYSSTQWTFGGGVLTDTDTDFALTNSTTYQPYIVVKSDPIYVGIGTKNPSYMLHVNGNIRAATNLSVGGWLNLGGTASIAGAVTITGVVSVGVAQSAYNATRAQLSVISSTTDPAMLWLGSNSTRKWSIESRGSADSYRFSIYSWEASKHMFYITHDGNTYNQGNLNVGGHIAVTATGNSYSGLYPNKSITGEGSEDTLWLYNSKALCLYGSEILLRGGAVTMSSGLTVTGNVTASASLCAPAVYGGTTSSYTWRIVPDAGSNTIYIQAGLVDKSSTSGNLYLCGLNAVKLNLLRFVATTTEVSGTLRPTSSGSYNLGNSSYRWSTVWGVDGNLSGALTVAGQTTINNNLIVTGDVATGSDVRFKDIIRYMVLDIEDIAKAPLFTFKWNDRDDDSVHLGTGAQYWEGVTPWFVKGTDFKTLDYASLGVAMGISLARKTVDLEDRVNKLEQENKALKAEIRRIQNGAVC